MKIAFMGSPRFAAVSLETLVKAGKKISVVVTQPDRQRGRGRQIQHTPVKEVALRYRIETREPITPNSPEFVDELKEMAPDLIVLVSYGHILRSGILSVPERGCINLHPSLLPKYRGAAPVHWTIINGERETGVTTMLMNEKIDAGQILEQRRVPVGEEETTGELSDRLAYVGAELLLSTLSLLESGQLEAKEQNPAEVTYAPKITPEMCRIDWTQDARKIARLVRGLSPSPGSFSAFRGKRVKLLRAVDLPAGTGKCPGKIVPESKRLLIEAGLGLLWIKELQFEGKKPMSGSDFVNGYQPQQNEQMG